ncbi:hypothetical protein WJX84_003925 [Apatococcus fuscideae]|uniref:DUF7148 domain-containing protein n=1 Tax=Apatococcus fuscideae TaxID=2026836 RepID=A0AAW1TKI0_9CHLO
MQLNCCTDRPCIVRAHKTAPAASVCIRARCYTQKATSVRRCPGWSVAPPRSAHRRTIKTCAGKTGNDAHLQLATARLPSNVDVDEFKRTLYNWAATLTTSGRNMPFSLPIKTTHTKDGFEMSLLRIFDGEARSVGDINVTVEEESGKGNILFARFYEGDGSFIDKGRNVPSDPMQRVQAASSGLVDVPIIMQTMRDAIKRAVVRAR